MVRAILDGRKTQTRRVERLRGALNPFCHLNPYSSRVAHKWDGFVSEARAALAETKEDANNE
jgi:hypothetical protein